MVIKKRYIVVTALVTSVLAAGGFFGAQLVSSAAHESKTSPGLSVEVMRTSTVSAVVPPEPTEPASIPTPEPLDPSTEPIPASPPAASEDVPLPTPTPEPTVITERPQVHAVIGSTSSQPNNAEVMAKEGKVCYERYKTGTQHCYTQQPVDPDQ